MSLPSQPTMACCSWPRATRHWCLDCRPGPYLWKTSLNFLLLPEEAGHRSAGQVVPARLSLFCRGVSIADTCSRLSLSSG